MGYSPRDIDDMTLWEFGACLDGWRKANLPDEGPEPPSQDEHLEMVRRLRERQTSS